MVNGGTPALRMALELTKDIPQNMTVAIMARLARTFWANCGLSDLAVNVIPSFANFPLKIEYSIKAAIAMTAFMDISSLRELPWCQSLCR